MTDLWLRLHDTGRQLVVAVQMFGACSDEAAALRAQQHDLVNAICDACDADKVPR